MSLPLLIVAIAFTLWGLLNMLRPFLAQRDAQLRFEVLDEELREIEGLMARKAALVQSLRDIEYDHQTAKISTEDYARFKRSHERRAVAIMRRLDAIHGGREWESHIEDAVAARQQALPEPEAQAPGAKDASQPPQKTAKATDACTECGEPLSPRARFCAICGTPRESSAADADERPRHAAPLTSEVTG
ncbi:zinc-ribbon domain-containing protein [Lujinxingia vulgaris]|uniref:Zinc-ribbon domain-containing protein n=1 Tax=Lujinxingia vulgaris TaxID=2600176 RepID=A0A5C6XL80_9DELT|nr:zinc ribbon domain-containing protein [Lujinxingia vulgaris]TXD38965.1 zinc-ribbon domain-containing protein [Lujinxingia vulgaris]